jgi:hypothetical protein
MAEGARINPENDDWESFGASAKEEREANGFDWLAWEAFAAREVGDGYGAIPELEDGAR